MPILGGSPLLKIFLTLTSSSGPSLDTGGLYRVDIVRCGKWDYPRPGAPGFEITPSTIKELADNFNAGLMGREVPLNIDHEDDPNKPRSLSDCGWVKGVEVSPNGCTLVGLIEITDPSVKAKVDQGSLKFSSAELDFERVCPELSAKGDTSPRKVLEGLALTNHPYIKRMNPISPAIQLSDRAALDAAGVHYPSVMSGEDDDAEKKPSVSFDHGNPGGTMPENITLPALQKENDALKARLAELENNTDSKAALAEARRLGSELKLRDTEEAIKKLIRRGKVPPALATRFLRFAEVLIKGNSGTLTLSEAVTGRKYKLAEGEEDSIDKLDVIQEVVDMLGQLPDAVAMDPSQAKLADDCDSPNSGDDDEELMKEADRVQAAEPKLGRRDAYAKARKNLSEKRGGKK